MENSSLILYVRQRVLRFPGLRAPAVAASHAKKISAFLSLWVTPGTSRARYRRLKGPNAATGEAIRAASGNWRWKTGPRKRAEDDKQTIQEEMQSRRR
jgi:hypothetical protein